MNNLEFSFSSEPWEAYFDSIDNVASAVTLLTVLEGQSEEEFEDALLELEQRRIALDLSDLPKPGGTGEAAVRLRQELQLAKQGLPVHQLEAGDPLRLYLEELAMTPSFGDEALLAEKSAEGDEKARLQLTNLSLSRVVEIACEHAGRGVLLMDLIQEGSLGLWQAVCSYQSGDFSLYRDWWIRFSMARAVILQARENGVGQKMRTALEDYRSVDERLLSELGRNPTQEEIADAMHLSMDAVDTVSKMVENARRLQQAKKAPEPEEEEEAQQQSVEDTAYFQMRQRIMDLLSGVSEMDAKILSLRYGLEGGLPLSAQETARKLGITPEETVTREASALAKLRTKQ